MIIWISGGFIAWISCLFFMLAIFKGGHRVRGNVYEQQLYFHSMINTKNRDKEGEKKSEGKTKDGRGVTDRRITDRRITERRSMDRRITEGRITDRIITEGVLIIERLKQRRLEQRRYGQRRNLRGFGWQEMFSIGKRCHP